MNQSKQLTHEKTNSVGVSNRDFRLISLYIGLFEPFKGQIMNFCSDYRTKKVENSKGRLRLEVKHKKVLPDNFFALNEGNEGNGCVKSVSAIIGNNGSGKTTIARLLCNLSASDDRKQKWKTILIYEENGNIKCCSTFKSVMVELVTDNGVRQKIAFDGNFPSCKIFYYSPHFTTEQFEFHTTGPKAEQSIRDRDNSKLVKNVSTTYLLLHPEEHSESLSVVGVKQSSIFDSDEKIRLFEFLAEYK